MKTGHTTLIQSAYDELRLELQGPRACDDREDDDIGRGSSVRKGTRVRPSMGCTKELKEMETRD